MPLASIPFDEDGRQAELVALGILDTDPEGEFNVFVELASKLLSTPAAAISLIDKDRQWFKARVGLTASQTPREQSFCAHAILSPDEVLYVPDATKDSRFAGNPLVTGEFGLRFYAGAPVFGPSGRALGALCVLDFQPRLFENGILQQLKQLAVGVSTALKLHAAARDAKALNLTDALTGLWSRAGFELQLEEAVRRLATTPGMGLGLVLVDLTGFRMVNDLLGHKTGDAVLREAANRLRKAVRPGDVLSRFDADKFGILIKRSSHTDDLRILTGRANAALAMSFQIEQASLPLRASIGAVWSEHAATATELINQVDAALSEAKRNGSGLARVSGGIVSRPTSLGPLGLEAELRAALVPGQEPFSLLVQPIYNVRSRKLLGFEALVRWLLPDGRARLPSEFIPIAEATGLIVPLDRWTLDRACALAAGWPHHIQISSNLSAANFLTGDLASVVEAILTKHDLAPQRLKLEVTESALLRDPPRVQATIAALHELGVKVIIDDFGAGNASLSYLSSYNFDGLKIDQGLVQDLEASSRSRAFVLAIVQLARALGVEVTAEGIETEGQFQVLSRAKVDLAQGYLLGRPSNPGDAAGLIEAPSKIRRRSRPTVSRKPELPETLKDGTRDRLRHSPQAMDDGTFGSPSSQDEWYRRGIAVLPDPFYVKNANHRFVAANAAVARVLGAASARSVIGRSDSDFHEPSHARRYREHEVAIMNGGPAVPIEQRVRRPDGSWGWFSVLKVAVPGEDGAAVGLVGHIRDITEAKHVEDLLERQTEELLQLTDSATRSKIEAERMRDVLVDAAAVLSDGFALFDPEDKLILCNSSFGNAFGATPDQLTGLTFAALLRLPAFRSGVPLDDDAYEGWLEQRLTSHHKAAGTPEEFEHGGRWFLIQERRTAHGSIVLSRAEITHLKRAEEDLRQLATRDALTGLWNRRHFATQGSRLLERAYHDGRPVVLMLVDIDHFKAINDAYGHLAGDEALRQVAFLCNGLLRPSDLTARWGGEEFAHLMLDVDLIMAVSVAERLRRGIAGLTVQHGGHAISLTASFGLAHSTNMAWSLDRLTAHADRALYRAKRGGRDCIKVAFEGVAATHSRQQIEDATN